MPLLDASGLIEDRARIFERDAFAAGIADSPAGERIGIAVASDADGEALACEAGKAALIAIRVDRTGDGRVFSLARTLRQQGYAGTIRAVGPLIPDQFRFALDCGIDQIEIDAEQLQRQPVEQWLLAADTVTRTYVGSDGIFARRAAARGAA